MPYLPNIPEPDLADPIAPDASNLDSEIDQLLAETREAPGASPTRRNDLGATPASSRQPIERTWTTYDAVVLIVYETECECCGTVHAAPNQSLMLRWRTGRRGFPSSVCRRWTAIGAGEADSTFRTLPRTIERQRGQASACPSCFHPTEDSVK